MLATIVRNIWFVTSLNDIKISVCHIVGRDNTIADLLSRWENYFHQVSQLQRLVQNFVLQDTSDELFQLDLEI